MRHFFLLIMFVCCEISFAQGFKVGSLKMNLSDLSASTQQRTDAEGQPCGLIKVQTKVAGVEFGGNVIGKVENKTNEYWVYLPKGTKEVVVMRPDYLPMSVNLSEYGIDAIDSKTTYTMVLKEVNLNPEKCGVTIHVKPREAQVKIDDVALKQNFSGDYKVLLPKGDHLVRIDASGHRPDINTITAGKGVQDINVELESLMADINIISQMGTAEIFVDEKSMGVGGWKGKMMPGRHVVEVRQEGYKTATNQVTIAEKEQRTITIPKLSPIVGTLTIQTTPSNCSVYLDGEEVDKSPCTISDVIYGDHHLLIKLDSCGLQRQKEYDIKIVDNKVQTVECRLASEEELNAYTTALKWFIKGCELDGGTSTNGDYMPNKESKEWYDRIMNIIDKLDKSFFTQVIVFPEYAEYGDTHLTPFYCMFTYYSWSGFDELGYCRWSKNQDYANSVILNLLANYANPDKALLLIEKVGWDFTPSGMWEDYPYHFIISIAGSYASTGDLLNPNIRDGYNKKNKTEALRMYKKAVEIMDRHFHDDGSDSLHDYKAFLYDTKQKIQKLQK